MVKVKVKRIVTIDKSSSSSTTSGEPLIINFEHGQVNPAVVSSVSRNLRAHVFESLPNKKTDKRASSSAANARGGSSRKRVAVIETSGMTYVGSSDNCLNHDSGKGDTLRTLIGIRRKKKLYIYEANSIIVSPYLQNYPHLKVKESNGTANRTPEEKKAGAIDLVKAFGSKKKILTYERMEKHQIDRSGVDMSMSTATETALLPDLKDMPDQKDTTILSLVPPCNRDTKDQRQVYLLDDILTQADLTDMVEPATQWLNCSTTQIQSWRASKTFSDYFFEMWKQLSARKNERSTMDKAKMVLYTELLICLLKLKFAEIRKKVPSLPKEFPSWLVQKALDNFTSVNATGLRCRSEPHKDKTCCYIMVLVLLANDFIFDVQLMSTSLQIHIKKLLTLAKAVGITVQHNATTKEYRGLLKLPLPQPIERRGRARNLMSRK